MNSKIFITIVFLLCFFIPKAHAGEVIDKIELRGKLLCGTSLESRAYAYKENGYWHGVDADFCNAVSIAIFGMPDKFDMIDISKENRFTALKKGKIDLLLGATPWTASDDLINNVDFTGVLFYSMQGFMAHYNPEKNSMESYKESRVCVLSNSANRKNLEKFNHDYELKFITVPEPNIRKLKEAFLLNRCELLSEDQLVLKAGLLGNFPDDMKLVVLPEVIDRKPSSPVVRSTDIKFRDIVNWVIYSMIKAEEKGITSKNVDIYKASNDDEVKNLLGTNPKLWKAMGLESYWAEVMIKNVGNYAEFYERNLGTNSIFKMDRGVNRLWTDGGQLWSPVFL